MKLFLVLAIVAKCLVQSEAKKNSYLSALEAVVERLSESPIEVLMIDVANDDWRISEAFKNSPHKLTNAKDLNQYKVNESGLLAFESVNSLKDFNRKVILTNNYPKQFRFFVLFREATIDELSTVKDTHILQSQYFLVDEEHFLKLMTFVWYTPKKCNETQLVEVNKFDKQSAKWENEKFFVEKFKSFHGCDLVFGAFFQNPACMFELNYIRTAVEFHLDPNLKVVQYSGYHVDMVKVLADHLNFKLRFNPFDERSKNFTFKDSPIDCHLRRTSLLQLLPHAKTHFMTKPYIFMNDLIAVPPGEDFSVYEKLLLPFDNYVWMFISLVFLFAISTIVVLRLSKAVVKDAVFGKNVTTPTLNVVGAFFGMTQTILPKSNFARIILTIFTLYCLIIRTAYQGKMFEFLQKDITKPQVKSLEEIIERNLTLYSQLDLRNIFDESSDFIRRTRIASIDIYRYMDIVFREIYDPKFEGAVHVKSETLYTIISLSRGQSILKRLIEERMSIEMFGMMFPKNHKFHKVFDDKFQELFEAGIIDLFLFKFSKKQSDPKRYSHRHSNGPKVLTMEHLKAGFVIWLASLTLTLLAFMCEWSVKFMEYWICKYVFQEFYELKIGLITNRDALLRWTRDQIKLQDHHECIEKYEEVEHNVSSSDEECFEAEKVT